MVGRAGRDMDELDGIGGGMVTADSEAPAPFARMTAEWVIGGFHLELADLDRTEVASVLVDPPVDEQQSGARHVQPWKGVGYVAAGATLRKPGQSGQITPSPALGAVGRKNQ